MRFSLSRLLVKSMYEAFFKLKEKPFNITPSHRFLYLSEGHKEALALLTYGVVERKGFILLTGDVGTGKTTVIQVLLNNLGTNIECIHFSNPLLSSSEFIDYLASTTFKRRVHFKSKADFLLEFEDYLKKAQQQQTPFVLIIDEAQTLSLDLLEEIRLLSNLESSEEKLINIFLVGQPELIDRLKDPRCRALYQRIASRYHLQPLNLEATRSYILTRLSVAGAADPDKIFSKKSIETIYKFSGGIPRIINILADNALLLGYSKGKSKISQKMIEESHRDMHLGEENLIALQGSQSEFTEGAGFEKRIKEKNNPWLRRGLVIALSLAILLWVWTVFVELSVREVIVDKGGMLKQMIQSISLSNQPPEKIEEPSTEGPSTPVGAPEKELPPPEPPGKAEPVQAKPERAETVKDTGSVSDTPEEPVSPPPLGFSAEKKPLLPSSDLIEEKKIEGNTLIAGDSRLGAAPLNGGEEITVKEGDYLAKIAMNVYGRADRDILEMVKKHNPQIRDINSISVGQVIVFPDLSRPSQEKIYTVHVASYRPGRAAQEAFRSLLEAGYDVFIVPFTSPQKQLIYRITIGNFKDEEGAKAYAGELLTKTEFDYANAVKLEMSDPVR